MIYDIIIYIYLVLFCQIIIPRYVVAIVEAEELIWMES